MQAGVIDEMMEDMMDSAMDEPELEQETEEEVDKVSLAGLVCCKKLSNSGSHKFGCCLETFCCAVKTSFRQRQALAPKPISEGRTAP